MVEFTAEWQSERRETGPSTNAMRKGNRDDIPVSLLVRATLRPRIDFCNSIPNDWTLKMTVALCNARIFRINKSLGMSIGRYRSVSLISTRPLLDPTTQEPPHTFPTKTHREKTQQLFVCRKKDKRILRPRSPRWLYLLLFLLLLFVDWNIQL